MGLRCRNKRVSEKVGVRPTSFFEKENCCREDATCNRKKQETKIFKFDILVKNLLSGAQKS